VLDTPAAKMLRRFEHVSEDELGRIGSLVREAEKSSEMAMSPEYFLVLLAREGSQLIARASAGIPLNRHCLKSLLADCGNSEVETGDTDSGEKGRQSVNKGYAWEVLASYLVLTLPNTSIIPNVRTYQDEIDIIAAQEGDGRTYLIDCMGRHFLVEGKNWKKPADAAALNHFASKVAFTDCRTGVLLSREGITGSEAKKVSDAELARQKWFQRDKFLILVITEEDIQRLIATSLDFPSLLIQKYRAVRFSIPPQ
jgi:hypothetical protein